MEVCECLRVHVNWKFASVYAYMRVCVCVCDDLITIIILNKRKKVQKKHPEKLRATPARP